MTPLWLPHNNTQDSEIFQIYPGTAALLIATGFERWRKPTSTREARSPQKACLRRLLVEYDEEFAGTSEPTGSCWYSRDFTKTNVRTIDVPVALHGCPWTISGCDNHKLLALPGIYYLRLNDKTAVSKAQVWVEMFSISDLPLEFLRSFTI